MPTKLPLWRTVREAYGLAFSHLPALLRAGWPVLLVGIAVIAGFEATVGWSLSKSGNGSWSGIVTPTLEAVVGAAMAVSLHRTILLGEPVLEPLAVLRRPEFPGYVRWALVLMTLAMLPMLGLDFAFGDAPVGTDVAPAAADTSDGPASTTNLTACLLYLAFGSAIIALIVLVGVALSYVPTRLSILLPARALGQSVAARDAWQATHRSFWRLFCGSLLSMGLVMLPMALYFGLGFGWAATRGVHVANAVLSSVCAIVGGMVGVAFLSLAYRHFFGDRLRPEPG